MKRSNLLVLATIMVGLNILTPAITEAAEPASNSSWGGKMQELYKILADLTTDVSSDSRFYDAANKYRIETEANKLASFTHDLKTKGTVSPDADPTIPLVAELLARQTKLAAAELKRGNRQYARSVLRAIPGYCIACHTRNASGPQFSQLAFEPSSKTLSAYDRGEFFAATRQFDRALQEFKQVIQDPKFSTSYNFDWKNAVNQSLAIAVRVKQSPAEAAEIIQAILNAKEAPLSMKEDAKAWQLSVQEWQSEPATKASTEEELHAKAVKLMAKARENQKYPMDHTADILYLRASAVTHSLMQKAPQGKYASEALLLAGLSYEVLSTLKIEDLHELYYEACIRKTPHTEIADLCYRRYEQSVILGYTGSAGEDIPGDIRAKFSELKMLSQPKLQSKPN